MDRLSCSTCLMSLQLSTYWSRVMHIWVSKQTIIGSNNGFSPGWRQAIIWTNAGICDYWTPGNKISVKFYLKFLYFHSRKCVRKCHLESGGHFVSASMRQWSSNEQPQRLSKWQLSTPPVRIKQPSLQSFHYKQSKIWLKWIQFNTFWAKPLLNTFELQLLKMCSMVLSKRCCLKGIKTCPFGITF